MLFRGLIAGQMSGSTAGLVASRNRGGAYFRGRSVPTNTNTVAQQGQRSAFGGAAIGWGDLTDAQRGGWASYAAATPITNRIGDSITLTGFNWYVAVNSFLTRGGQAAIDDAPIDPGLATLGEQASIVASVSLGVSLTTQGSTVDNVALVSYSPIKSAGTKYIYGPYSAYAYVVGPLATGFNGSLQTVQPGRYGPLQEGEVRAFRIRGVDAVGRLSNVIERLVLVGA